MKNNFKSYSFWTALAGAVVIFLNALGDVFGFSVDNDLVKGLIMAFAGILVVLGVVTMPNDKDKNENSTDVDNSNNEIDNDDENVNDEKTSKENLSGVEENKEDNSQE